MTSDRRTINAAIPRLLAIVSLLSYPVMTRAAGTWSTLPFPIKPGEVISPTAVTNDGNGSLYVADQSNGGMIQKRDADGSWSVIATAGQAVSQVGYAGVLGLGADAAGNLYVADRGDGGRVQRRDPQGNWSVIAPHGAGLGQVGDASASSLAVNAAGELYVADSGTAPDFRRRIQKRDAQGHWSTIAAQGTALGQVYAPAGVAVDAAGDLYVLEQPAIAGSTVLQGRIQKRDAWGNWSLIAAGGAAVGQVHAPSGLAADPEGNLYVAETHLPAGLGVTDGAGHVFPVPPSSARLQMRDAQGHWSLLASEGSAAGQVFIPQALATDAAGNLYVVEQKQAPLGGTDRIQVRDARNNWSVLASGGQIPLELRAPPGQLFSPFGIAVDLAGNLYVADPASSWLLKRDTQENWSLLASAGDAPGQVRYPQALAVDRAGNLYVADQSDPAGVDPPHGRLQRRDAQGRWSVITPEDAAPGQAFNASSLAVDAAGNLYVAERAGNYDAGWIHKRDPQGNWSVIAAGGTDLGQVRGPIALAEDATGSLYVAEQYLYLDGGSFERLQKRDAQGNWSVIATPGDPLGPFNSPMAGLAVDATGNLYVTDNGRSRIQVLDPQGHWSVLAATGSSFSQVDNPSGLAVDAAGALYVADTGNHRVQLYTPNGGP